MTIADEIMDYLTRDLADNGGQARRLSKIQMELSHWVEDDEFSKAIQELVDTKRAHVEGLEYFPWIYLWPGPA
jgi:hypothetical protein